MECNELLALLTLGAVAPYLAEAAVRWICTRNECAAPPGAHHRCAYRRSAQP